MAVGSRGEFERKLKELRGKIRELDERIASIRSEIREKEEELRNLKRLYNMLTRKRRELKKELAKLPGRYYSYRSYLRRWAREHPGKVLEVLEEGEG